MWEKIRNLMILGNSDHHKSVWYAQSVKYKSFLWLISLAFNYRIPLIVTSIIAKTFLQFCLKKPLHLDCTWLQYQQMLKEVLHGLSGFFVCYYVLISFQYLICQLGFELTTPGLTACIASHWANGARLGGALKQP